MTEIVRNDNQRYTDMRVHVNTLKQTFRLTRFATTARCSLLLYRNCTPQFRAESALFFYSQLTAVFQEQTEEKLSHSCGRNDLRAVRRTGFNTSIDLVSVYRLSVCL